MKKRIKEYDILRVLLVILVVIGHAGYYKIKTNGYGGIDYAVDGSNTMIYKIFKNIVEFIYCFHMPAFFSLSGALYFYEKEKYKTVNVLIKDKCFKLIKPFVLVSFLYVIPIKYLTGYFTEINFVDIIKGQLFGFGNSHLWFLVSLFLIFIIVYILDKKVKNEKLKLVILFILNLISGIGNQNVFVVKTLENCVWFYVGYLFEERRIEYNKGLKKNSNEIILFVISVILFVIENTLPNIMIVKILKNIIKIVITILMVKLIYDLAFKLKDNEKIVNNKYIKKLLNYSFEIYLYSDAINYVILYIVSKININILCCNFGALAVIFIRIIFSLEISILVGYSIRKIKNLGRYEKHSTIKGVK